jgi:hypothetical protein
MSWAASTLPGVARGCRTTSGMLWPQGWSFFDRVSEEDVSVVYREQAGADPLVATWIQMSAQNSWGLGRTGRPTGPWPRTRPGRY